jgi:choline dehydrogenase-like flavoprotein
MANDSSVRAALAAICDTFIASEKRTDDPNGYWSRSASDLGIPDRILALLATAKAEDQANFKQLTDLLTSPMLGLTWGGPLRPVHRLTPEQRQRLLHAWAKSPLALLRNAFNTLRKATTLLYYGDIQQGTDSNPNWADIGYAPVAHPPIPHKEPMPLVDITGDTTLDCDVLVIGSGSGGGVVAATLARAGQSVLVVEKGEYAPRESFTRREFPMMNRHFEAGALLATDNGSVTVMAGSTLGGGSSINWAGSLRTPDYVLDEWAKEHHNPHFNDTKYHAYFEQIEQRTSVGQAWKHDPQNQALYSAAEALGWRAEYIPMNMRVPDGMSPDAAWEAAGFSCMGDAYGIKQGTHETFLRDAVQAGARVLVGLKVDHISTSNGSATGATGTVRHSDGRTSAVTIRAKRVVVSAGSLHTPVLLLKSGLTHPQIGRNLFLHPVVPMAAFYPTPTRPWLGPMMSVVVQEFARLHENWGFRLECPPIHPGLAASALSWESSTVFKADMLRLSHLAVHICLVRDRFGGRVTVGKRSGEPVLHYELNDYDRRHLIRSMQESARAHDTAGATEICVLSNTPRRILTEAANMDAFRADIARMPWGTNRMGLYSAHQMGTCRMGGTKDYPVQPDGATREVRGLYVADASLFPSASGSNPMLSTQALALHVANGML